MSYHYGIAPEVIVQLDNMRLPRIRSLEYIDPIVLNFKTFNTIHPRRITNNKSSLLINWVYPDGTIDGIRCTEDTLFYTMTKDIFHQPLISRADDLMVEDLLQSNSYTNLKIFAICKYPNIEDTMFIFDSPESDDMVVNNVRICIRTGGVQIL